MSDQRLRELERRWRDTGTAEDEAAYLLERMRTGRLDVRRVGAAAALGHVGAALTGVDKSQVSSGEWYDLLSLCVDQLDAREQVRLICDCVEHTLHRWEELAPDDSRPREALRLAREWADGHVDADELEVAANNAAAASESTFSASLDRLPSDRLASDPAKRWVIVRALIANAAEGAARIPTKGMAGKIILFLLGNPEEERWQVQQLVSRLLHDSGAAHQGPT